MFRKIMIGLISAMVVAICGVSYVLINDMFFDTTDTNEEQEADASGNERAGEQRDKIQGIVTDDELEKYEQEALNPFGENIKAEDLRDADFQEYIHGMSHQKVRADMKWGFYELHPNRVEWLLEALDEETEIYYADDYERILKKWLKKDFSSIDKDHNTIWKMQGGTVGKATGILSPEEEAAYVESQGGE
ncbi:DUF6241 domain-containing protein [Lentibacillus saliphilus]|uniref:DUF6241 domain-containing protein n=1 Tax=Lentibacillus saliphilus TaxID=2737028 RepID=UPI001C3109A5|nr:DUF6241 domain-containing protein [Lentibacillus saliphilus]